MKKAIFPGSFDPITLGHVDIINRGLDLFDEIVLAIGINADKKHMYTLEQRKTFLENTYKDESKIKVKTYRGLTIDFCQKENARFILRGLRNPIDFEFEKSIARTNFQLKNIETIFLFSSAGKDHISSTIVRDIIRHQGDFKSLVPDSAMINYPQKS